MSSRCKWLGLLMVTISMSSALAVTHNDVGPSPLQKALRNKTPYLKALFQRRGLAFPPHELYLRVFKKERELELWARAARGKFQQIKRYDICAASGDLGPKRRSGDTQVPEGIYHINRFNPRSRFHLSLGINYPNRADKIHGKKGHLGRDIFIHGDCVSIGCVAITNENIEELYVTAAAVYSPRPQRVPVHIFPARLDPKGYALLSSKYTAQPQLLKLWAELRPLYEFFERHKELPQVFIDSQGRYNLTARSRADHQATEIMDKGCNGLIQKPFGIDTLISKPKEVL